MKIPLRGKRGRGKFVLIDAPDYKLVKNFRWYLHTTGQLQYARAYSSVSKHGDVLMHRVIMNPPKDKTVDHRNGNGLDNRRTNLRACTRRENSRNSRPRKDTSSRYKGVAWSKGDQDWVVNILVGHFNSELQAAKTYDQAARLLFGDFARLNFEQKKIRSR